MSSPILTPDGKWAINLSQATLNQAVVTTVPATLNPATIAILPAVPASSEPIIPASSVTIDMLTKKWAMNHDPGTPGSSSGTSVYPFTAEDGSIVRRNTVDLTAHGGEIYHAQVLADSSMFDTFCYELVLSSPAASGGFGNINNIETDFEHVWSDGTYVDLAVQLASGSGAVEVTENGHWVATKVPANPLGWAPTVLHTIRHYTKDNGDGNVVYIGSYVDGVYADIGITIGDKKKGPWARNDLNMQLQFDGASSGEVISIIDIHVIKAHCWKS